MSFLITFFSFCKLFSYVFKIFKLSQNVFVNDDISNFSKKKKERENKWKK